jgi:hypothetical protein
VALGENSIREARRGCGYSLHAEMDAIRKLPPLRMRGRKKEITLLVIRIDRHGNLKNSAPCFKCLEYIKRVNCTTSYSIKEVCYSDENGNIVIKKAIDLINAKVKHISLRFRKNIHESKLYED